MGVVIITVEVSEVESVRLENALRLLMPSEEAIAAEVDADEAEIRFQLDED